LPPPSRSLAVPAARPFTERQFRDALAQFAAGVTVIATRRGDGRCVGFTASSFNSVSLDPPLVVWNLNRRAENLAAFEAAEHYAISVLAHDQAGLAQRFAERGVDRFDGVAFRAGVTGAPLIDGCIAWFECRHFARHDAGDHVLFVGEVEACARREGDGLVWHHGRYATTRPIR
jgi:flavin reductase (DIM6/NTAB) family NADH-FMN oxidoreductase RutF